MMNDIRCRSGLNIVRDSEATCGSVPPYIETYSKTVFK